jgi:O-antigen ligase
VTRFLPRALLATLIAGILTMWVKASWALALFQVAIFLSGAICVMGRILSSRTFRTSILLIPLGVTAAWPMLQLILHRSAYTWETQSATLRWCAMLVVFAVALQVFEDHGVRSWFRRKLLILGCLLAVVSTLQLFSAPGRVFWIFPTDYTGFVLGPFVYRNQYAAFIELLLPIAIVAALDAHESVFLMTSAAAVMYASVIAASSRTGAILVTAEVILIFSLAAWKQQLSMRRLSLALAGMIMFAGILSAAVGSDTLWERFHQSDPYRLRLELLHSSADMIRERPWIGFGLGTWPTVYPAYAYFDDGLFVNQAHNDWAQWTVEGGLPFVAMLAWVFLWSTWSIRKYLWGLGVIAVFLHAFVDYPFEKLPLSALCLTILGMIAAAQTSTK